MSVAYGVLRNRKKQQEINSWIRFGQLENGGIKYSERGSHNWIFFMHNDAAVAPTAWAYFAFTNINPFNLFNGSLQMPGMLSPNGIKNHLVVIPVILY